MNLPDVIKAFPLDRRRAEIYMTQTGRKTLTPRQRRRIEHKANHRAAPFGEKASL